MKKIDTSINVILPYVVIYLNDIKEIINVLVSCGITDYKIQANWYVFDDIDDLLKIRKLDTLEVSSKSYDFNIKFSNNFNENWVQIYFSEDSILNRWIQKK